jgi:GntR family transcriptional regulator
VRRHQGLGTFVARERIVSEPTRSGELLATLTGRQGDPELSTELLGIVVGLPSPTIARSLGIGVGQPVWEVTRRRLFQGVPVILETAALPVHLVPTLDQDWLARGDSMYRLLAEQYNLVDEYEEQYLEVAVPTVAECEALGLSAREYVVRIRGVSFGTDRAPFDCYEQTYPAREFVFYVSGSTSRHLLQPPGGRDWSVTPLVPSTVAGSAAARAGGASRRRTGL